MELDERMEKFNDITDKWNEHMALKMNESLKKAIVYKNDNNIDFTEIGDIGAIDSIEDKIVRCEILDGNMIEIPKSQFKYKIEEGDIINLKLTYQEGKLIKIDVLDKNDEEKLFRIKMMQEKMKQMRNRK